MKKIAFIIMAVLFCAAAFAQDRKISELKVKELPKEVSIFIAKNFAGGTITRAGKIEEKGDVSYLAVIERAGTKHAYQFDKEGKLIGKADNILSTLKPGEVKTAPAGTSTQPAAKPPVKTGTEAQQIKK